MVSLSLLQYIKHHSLPLWHRMMMDMYIFFHCGAKISAYRYLNKSFFVKVSPALPPRRRKKLCNFKRKSAAMKVLFSSLILFCCCLISFSQFTTPLRFQRLGIEDGLPDANITCIEQDADGFLWIGTTNGLSRYDGAEFKNFFHFATKNSLPGNHIIAIKNYDSSHLLIATATGLSLLNVHTLQCKNFLVAANSLMFNLENCFLNITVDSQKNIWAGSRTTLYCLSPELKVLKAFRGFSEKDYNLKRMSYVQEIKILPDNQVLVHLQNRDWDGDYFLVNTQTNSLQLLQQQLHHSLQRIAPFKPYRFIWDDKRNIYFIKANSDSLFYFEPLQQQLQACAYKFSHEQEQYSLQHAALLELDKQHFVSVFQQGGFSVVPVTENHSFAPLPVQLKDQAITAVKKDKEGNLWAGSENGLFKCTVTSKNISSLFINPGTLIPDLLAGLRKIFFIGDSVWLSSNSSGYFITDKLLHPAQVLSFKENKELNITWSVVAVNNDTLWVNTQNGLRWLNVKNYQHEKLAIGSKPPAMDSLPITSCFKDSKGLFWIGIGFGNGLAQYNPVTHSFFYYSAKTGRNRLPIRYPVSIAEDAETNLWMGNKDGVGLVRWIRSTNRFELITPTYQSTFDNALINVLYCNRKKILWIGTFNGLIRYDISSKTFTRYDAPNRLLSGYINGICEDGKGRLWVGTNYGLSCYLPNENRFVNFTYQNVLPESKVNDVAYDSTTKKIFFTTDKYVGAFLPDQLLLTRIPLKIRFTGIQIDNQEKEVLPSYTVPYQQNDINLYFTAVNLTDGEDNEYAYSINGKEWISIGKQRQLRLSNLSPGNYTIAVRAISGSGKQSINQVNIVFIIQSPFWQTWWFYLICVVLLGLLLYALYRYRIQQLLKWQKARDRIATDLHDDIGSTLTNISILSELSNKTLHEPQQAKQFLQRISEEVHASSQAMDDIIWSVNSRNDSLEETMARMRRYAADLFDSSAVNCYLQLDENTEGKKLSMEQRRDVYLIYKESLNNIYKHAEAKNVWVSVRQQHQFIRLTIKDDGKGFKPDLPTHRNGLKNLEARVKKWKGKIAIKSEPGKGTSIEVEMPVRT